MNVFLLLVIIEVLRNAFNHLTGRAQLRDISGARMSREVCLLSRLLGPLDLCRA